MKASPVFSTPFQFYSLEWCRLIWLLCIFIFQKKSPLCIASTCTGASEIFFADLTSSSNSSSNLALSSSSTSMSCRSTLHLVADDVNIISRADSLPASPEPSSNHLGSPGSFFKSTISVTDSPVVKFLPCSDPRVWRGFDCRVGVISLKLLQEEIADGEVIRRDERVTGGFAEFIEAAGVVSHHASENIET